MSENINEIAGVEPSFKIDEGLSTTNIIEKIRKLYN